MIYFTKFQGKEAPLSFSALALNYWADKVEKDANDLLSRLDRLSPYEATWLAFSALKFGLEEHRNRAFRMTIHEFSNHANDHPEELESIFECFGKHLLAYVKEHGLDVESETAEEKKIEAETSLGDTSASAQGA